MTRLPIIIAAVLVTVLLMPAVSPAADDGALPGRIVNKLGMKFVKIPAGSFIMGSPASEKGRRKNEVQHKVAISKTFYMQTTEVTLAQWWAVIGKRFWSPRKGPEQAPVTDISYFDAMNFIDKLNGKTGESYRLPTESEWEYACRAGSSTAYSWGNDVKCANAMYANNPIKESECVAYIESRKMRTGAAAKAGSYSPNAWGLYDLQGNVWELCSDWAAAYPKGAVVDPKGPPEGDYKIRRGGSWFRGASRLRCANRNITNPGSRYRTMGFRLVKDISKAKQAPCGLESDTGSRSGDSDGAQY